MTYLSVEQLSKSYGLKTLFENLTFGISKGDKTALVAPNGTGKSTLLKVLAGSETADSGQVMVRNGITIGYLEQEPALNASMTIREYISHGHSDVVEVIRAYEKAVEDQEKSYNDQTHAAFEKALAAMDAANAWDYEQRMTQILGKLDIHGLDQSIGTLSGGEKKRVALAFVLLENPDLLLLDEPTNHLDVDMIEWLENYLATSNSTLLMITHDRYFLDRVCNHILEIDGGVLYHHDGNYSLYLMRKAERQEVEQVESHKAVQLYKKELEWMRRAPKARTTKSKSRIDAFYDTEERAKRRNDSGEVRLEVNMTRMGNKIVELKGVNKAFGSNKILDGFSYSFSKGERIGVIGRNGAGKSTFLNVLTGQLPPDSGEIETGSTIVFGHYRQQGIKVDESKRVIDILKEVAEVIHLADGKRITASQFLEHFMFPPAMQYTPVAKLSGGEKRRLGLMMVLISNPNFLILDEPTNDLDLITMQKLEEFLLDFPGCLIIVSHDRFFMDKLVQHYFVFEGEGRIRDFNGTYAEWRDLQKEEKSEQIERSKKSVNTENKSSVPISNHEAPTKKGLSFKERKEYQKLEKEITDLGVKKTDLESKMSAGNLDYGQLQELSSEHAKVQQEIEEKELRWLELAEMDS
jgi:ABC transport system ATP-binding/permease protein